MPALHPQLRRASLFCSAALLAVTARSQVVTWDASHAISGAGNVITTGTLVAAFNLGPAGIAAVTVNGVTFQPFVLPGFESNSTSASNGDYQFAENIGIAYGADGADFGSGAFAALSPASYQELLSTYAAASEIETLTLTLGGLLPGHDYVFEWWSNQSGDVGGAYGTTTATMGESLTLDLNTTDVLGGVGEFGSGIFTATGIDLDIAFTGEFVPTINAFQLRDVTIVPEPATWAAVVGLVAFCLACFRRSRQRRV